MTLAEYIVAINDARGRRKKAGDELEDLLERFSAALRKHPELPRLPNGDWEAGGLYVEIG